MTSVTGPEPGSAESESLQGQQQLTIQQASRLLQVPAPTIRSWERRYQIPQVDRSSGGHRRYTQEQVRTLRRMRDAIAQGQSAADAALLIKTATLSSLKPMIDRLLEATHRLQPAAIVEVLDSAHHLLGLDRTIDEVLFPAMQQVGRDWRIGRCDVAHEHLVTETTRGWLAGITRTGQQAGTRPLVLACGPRDLHTLGLEALGALLRQKGWDCRLLGASLPAASLATAVSELDPVAVILVSHVAVARRSAVESLRAVKPSNATIFYAGNAFLSRQARAGVPGTYLGDRVGRAAELIATTLSRPTTVDSVSGRDSG